MSGYNDYLLTPAAKTNKKLKIHDFFSGLNTSSDQSVLPFSVSPYTYNFDFSSGSLKDGYGLEDMGLNTSLVTNIWRYSRGGSADEEILMFARGGYIYYIRNGAVNQLTGVQSGGKIFTSNYRLYGSDVVIIFSDESPLIVWDGVNAAYTVSDSPRIKSMDTHEGLIFIADADGETLRYTSDLDPTNWNGPVSEGGSLRLADGRGRISKVISFMSYLYVFRDYGISRVAVKDGKPSSAGLYISSGRIYGDTVTLCGNKVVFLAEDGLYEFDGLSTKKVLAELGGFVLPDGNARAAYCGGKYFLTCRAAYPSDSSGLSDADVVGCEAGEYVNNALIVYNLSDGRYSVSRGMDILELGSMGGQAYAVCGGKAAKIIKQAVCFGQPLKKLWRSPFSDIGSEKTKLFKEIHIESSGDIILSIATENGKRAVLVKGSPVPQRIRFNLRGKKVSFSVESGKDNAYVSRPVLVFSEV